MSMWSRTLAHEPVANLTAAARFACLLASTVLFSAVPVRTYAQGPSALTTQDSSTGQKHSVTDPKTKTLFTRRDAALAGGFFALTIAMFPLDKSFASRLQDSS